MVSSEMPTKLVKHKESKAIHAKYSKLFNDTLSQVWESNTGVKYIIHVGKTNSGKTFNAVQKLKESGNGVYLAPLRLLAWEIYEKLNIEGYRCNLVTGEEQVESPNAKLTSSTIEMANYQKEYEVAVIDESFMLGDEDRGKSWLNAILTLKAKEIHIISNHESLNLITRILDLTDRKYEIKKYEMLQKFKFADAPFTLNKRIPKRGVFVTFSRINVLINKMKLEQLGHKASILYGNLPPEVKKKQIADFIDGSTDMLVTTDVIGMGINIPCDYIVFLEIEKYDGKTNRRLTPTEIKQISGRTGRFGIANENCFVSTLKSNELGYIKSNYNVSTDLQRCFFGMSYDIFSSFPEDTTMYNRIKYFNEIDFIPERLKGIIKKESVQKYLDIQGLIDRHETLDLKTKWVFLTAPVKYNNKNFFEDSVHHYAYHKNLKVPHINNHYTDSKVLEDVISEIELYLNLTRHLNHTPEEKNKIMLDKEVLIERLTAILMDKKLANKKKCKLCDTMISITSPFPNCENCYETKIRSRYSYNHRWDDDFNDDDF